MVVGEGVKSDSSKSTVAELSRQRKSRSHRGPPGGDGDLGGGPAGPLTDLVVCLGEVSDMRCHGDSFLNEDAAAVHAAGASRR